MTTYFSTFISGLSEVISRALLREVPNVSIKQTLDGLIVYSVPTSSETIKKLRFFNNSFLLLKHFKGETMEEMVVKSITDNNYSNIIRSFVGSERLSFRMVFSFENQMIAVDNDLVIGLENKLKSLGNLFVSRSNPHLEFWFVKRREGVGFFGIRVTKHPDYADVLEKGELRPELANLLAFIAEPSSNDVFLDPFAGVGAISSELTAYFPHKRVIASDNDPERIKKLKKRLSKTSIEIRKWDALKLDEIKTGSISKIVTDPPWGFFGKEKLSDVFYKSMLLEFQRVLISEGVAIILIGDKTGFEKVLAEVAGFSLQEKYDILVSGKKAAIYKIQRMSEMH